MKISKCLFFSLFFTFVAQAQTTEEEMEEVYVQGVETRDLTETSLETEKLLAVPGAGGDPLQAVFSLPGVLISDSGEPAVRGSSPEDNAFLVDYLPAGNVYHTFGFSIFSKHLLSDFQLLPAAYPAQYGGATGAVFDITTRDPKAQDFEFILDTTMINLGFVAEGQIADGHQAYFSYRKSLLELFLDTGEQEEGEGFILSEIPDIQDYQGKYTWDISDIDKFTFSILGSSDEFSAELTADSVEALIDPDVVGRQAIDRSFDRQSMVWDRFNDDGSNLKVALGFYQDELQIALGAGQFLDLVSDDVVLRTKYAFNANQSHRLTIGATLGVGETSFEYDAKVTPCTDFDPDCQAFINDRAQDSDKIKTNFYELYVQDEWQVTDVFAAIVGLNASDDDYLKENLLEPRLAFEWRARQDRFARLAMGEYHRTPDGEQIIRGIGNPELDNFKARHLTLSYGDDDKSNWDWKADIYYKELYDLAVVDSVLNYVNNAEGEAYGVELLVEKLKSDKKDKWYGWASLSWSRSERTDLRTNETSKFTGDTPVVFNLVYSYQFSPRWNVGARYTYRTGAAYTPVVGIEPNPDFPNLFRPLYGDLNSERLPAYQRLDIRSEYDFKMFGNDAKFIFEVLNLTNNDNITSINYEPTTDDTVDSFNLVAEKGLELFPSLGLQVIF